MSDNWIPVSEKLPKEGDVVLAWHEYYRYGDYNRLYQTYGLAYVYQGGWYSVEASGIDYKVLYWQPLPPKPNKED